MGQAKLFSVPAVSKFQNMNMKKGRLLDWIRSKSSTVNTYNTTQDTILSDSMQTELMSPVIAKFSKNRHEAVSKGKASIDWEFNHFHGRSLGIRVKRVTQKSPKPDPIKEKLKKIFGGDEHRGAGNTYISNRTVFDHSKIKSIRVNKLRRTFEEKLISSMSLGSKKEIDPCSLVSTNFKTSASLDCESPLSKKAGSMINGLGENPRFSSFYDKDSRRLDASRLRTIQVKKRNIKIFHALEEKQRKMKELVRLQEIGFTNQAPIFIGDDFAYMHKLKGLKMESIRRASSVFKGVFVTEEELMNQLKQVRYDFNRLEKTQKHLLRESSDYKEMKFLAKCFEEVNSDVERSYESLMKIELLFLQNLRIQKREQIYQKLKFHRKHGVRGIDNMRRTFQFDSNKLNLGAKNTLSLLRRRRHIIEANQTKIA